MLSAHDQALARSGKSITAGDVIKAVAEMDFGPADVLIPLLEKELAGETTLINPTICHAHADQSAYRANVLASKTNKARPNAAGRGRGRKSQVQAEEEDSILQDDADGDDIERVEEDGN